MTKASGFPKNRTQLIRNLILNVTLILMSVGCERKQDAGDSSRHNLDTAEAVIRKHLNDAQSDRVRTWRHFGSAFPQSVPSFGIRWDERVKRFTGNATRTAVLAQRYAFKVILDVQITETLNEVAFSNLRFHFYEITKVTPNAGGGASIIISTTNQRYFGKSEWITLTNTGWNFKVLGLTVQSNRPVANINVLTNP